jgi:predicted HAD superfamily Cof-like phosphohydrolase
MRNCTVCGSEALYGFETPAKRAYAWWCEDCGSMHVEDDDKTKPHQLWAVKKSMLHHQVLAFHKRFGQSIGEKPHVPDEKTMRFRLSLIAEEFCELLDATIDETEDIRPAVNAVHDLVANASIHVNFPAFVDATLDLDYVVEGTRITMGVDGTPIAAEVQRANMAKLPSYVAAKDESHGKAHEHTWKQIGWEYDDSFFRCTSCGAETHQKSGVPEPTDGPAPVKREDGKIMKPPGWTPPDVEGELKKQGWEP